MRIRFGLAASIAILFLPLSAVLQDGCKHKLPIRPHNPALKAKDADAKDTRISLKISGNCAGKRRRQARSLRRLPKRVVRSKSPPTSTASSASSASARRKSPRSRLRRPTRLCQESTFLTPRAARRHHGDDAPRHRQEPGRYRTGRLAAHYALGSER